MCGDYDSVIGMQKDEPIRRMHPEDAGLPLGGRRRGGDLWRHRRGDWTRAASPRRVAALRLGPNLEESRPQFWD